MIYISSNGERWTTSPIAFFESRWKRIVPIYLIATAVLVALYFVSGNFGQWSPWQYLTSALLIPYFDNITRLPFPILGQGWTLIFEMFFYFLFAISLNFTRSRGLLFLFILFPALVVTGFAWNFAAGTSLELTPVQVKPNFIVPRFWLHPIILEFLAGISLGVARDQLTRRGPLNKFSHPIELCLALIGGYVILSNVVDTASLVPTLLRFCCATSVVAICVLTRGPRVGSSAQRSFIFLGGCSYSLYLFHPHVLFLLQSAWKRVGAHLPMNLFVPIAVSCSVFASIIIYKLVEVRIVQGLRPLKNPPYQANLMPR